MMKEGLRCAEVWVDSSDCPPHTVYLALIFSNDQCKALSLKKNYETGFSFDTYEQMKEWLVDDEFTRIDTRFMNLELSKIDVDNDIETLAQQREKQIFLLDRGFSINESHNIAKKLREESNEEKTTRGYFYTQKDMGREIGYYMDPISEGKNPLTWIRVKWRDNQYHVSPIRKPVRQKEINWKMPLEELDQWIFLESWIDPSLDTPYILLLVSMKVDDYRIFDPASQNEIIYYSKAYQDAFLFLREDGYQLLGERYCYP